MLTRLLWLALGLSPADAAAAAAAVIGISAYTERGDGPTPRIDHLVWTKLWVWAKRRHPHKPIRWIKARYFERHGLRDWSFACVTRPPELAFWPMLFRLAGLTVKRHTTARSDANPSDSALDPN